MKNPSICRALIAGTAAILFTLLGACGGTPVEPTVAESAPVAPPPPPSSRPRPAPAPETAPPPAPIVLSATHPDRYTVVKGDTLWDISGMFLKNPWYWPEIWQVNPQIANPHLIYPGDVISLIYVDGRPQLRIDRAQAAAPPRSTTDRLSPRIRVESLDQAITTIPYDLISPFLSQPTIVSKKEAKNAPYIVAIKESHLVAGNGFHVYVRGDDLNPGASFALYHIGDEYRDPDNNDLLGYAALYIGQGRITRGGDPATLVITDSKREILAGDRLLPVSTDVPLNFFPAAPDHDVEGRIIDVVDGVSLIGQYQIVALNRGLEDGLKPGHVLEVFQSGVVVRDRFRRTAWGAGKKVRLPEERNGTLMVFRSLEEISFALIMHATSEIRVLDTVRNP